jgi:hypothetical protein
MNWPALLLLLGSLVAGTVGRAAGVEDLLTAEEKLWTMAPADFMTTQKCGFRWVSTAQDVARAAGGALTFADLRVYEAQARFENHRLSSLLLSLYNRGDAGDLEEAKFDALVQSVDAALTKWAGAKGVSLREQERTGTIVLRRMAWVRAPHRLDLTWTFTPRKSTQPFRAEFVRLEIAAHNAANAPRPGFQTTAATQGGRMLTAMEIRARVKREPNGDVIITGIPMVDQGQKGYCAAAVMERVLRYFGREMDQHEIAQMANTATKGGTSTRGMLSALRQMGGELGMEVVEQQKFDFSDFEKLVGDYNRAAQRAKKPEVTFDRRGGPINLNAIYGQMDADLLRESRVKRDSAMQNFKTMVARYVNAGCPVAWSVIMGKVVENPAVQGGNGSGHLRLIIGLNSLKNEILYSDTWGPKHELKRMSLADAWTITVDAYTIEPRNMRF